jgi:hypothetical protein
MPDRDNVVAGRTKSFKEEIIRGGKRVGTAPSESCHAVIWFN